MLDLPEESVWGMVQMDLEEPPTDKRDNTAPVHSSPVVSVQLCEVNAAEPCTTEGHQLALQL
jgi:hypothetical protein